MPGVRIVDTDAKKCNAPIPLKRAVAAAPESKTCRLFLSKTTSDYAGKDVEAGAKVENFAAFRDPHPPGAEGLAGRHFAGSLQGEGVYRATFGSLRPRRAVTPMKVALTDYTMNMDQKDMEGTALDFATAKAIRDTARGMGPVPGLRGDFVSCYGALCKNRPEGIMRRPGLDYDLADNTQSRLKTILTPTVDTTKNPQRSFAATQHCKPAKELVFENQTWAPQNNLGNVPSATDFFRSESHRQFRHEDVIIKRCHSAPLGGNLQAARQTAQVADRENLDKVLRQALMTSQSRATYGAPKSRPRQQLRATR